MVGEVVVPGERLQPFLEKLAIAACGRPKAPRGNAGRAAERPHKV